MEDNDKLITLLASGEVCVIPTDTVYGVVGLLDSPEAVAKIYDVKQRDTAKPVGTILAASPEQIAPLTSTEALKSAMRFWPGPVSVILPVNEAYAYAHKGAGSLAIRVPADEPLRKLLEKTGPLASSSANIQDKPPATTIEEAWSYFGDRIACYVNGGDLSHRSPSRIIEIAPNGTIKAIRE